MFFWEKVFLKETMARILTLVAVSLLALLALATVEGAKPKRKQVM